MVNEDQAHSLITGIFAMGVADIGNRGSCRFPVSSSTRRLVCARRALGRTFTAQRPALLSDRNTCL